MPQAFLYFHIDTVQIASQTYLSTEREDEKCSSNSFYDKRCNVVGLPRAKDIILNELTKRVHRIFLMLMRG